MIIVQDGIQSKTTTAPSAWVSFYLIDDSGVLFCRRSKRLFWLNSTAAFIWCMLEETRDGERIVGAVAETFGLPPARAAEFTQSIVREWRSVGLLPDGAGPALPAAVAGTDGEAARFRPIAERDYRILWRHVRIRYASADQEARVHPVFAHLAEPPSVAEPEPLDIREDEEGYEIGYRSQRPIRVRAIDELAPAVKAALFTDFVDTETRLVALHAGAVCRDSEAVLLPGVATRGKSTLTAALVRHGFQYLTDDIALLDDETLGVFGVPFSIAIKTTGLAPLRPLYPDIDKLPRHVRPDGKEVIYLPPPRTAFRHDPSASYPVRYIVFPHYLPGSECRLAPVDRGEALRRIVEQSGANDLLDEAAVGRLVGWIRRTRCFDLTLSGLPEAVSAVRALWR